MTKLLFISYMNRSGSTFLTSRLNSNRIVSCPESEVLIDRLLVRPDEACTFSDKQCKSISRERKLREWDIGEKRVDQILKTTKTNFQKFKAILELYRDKVSPEAEIILFKGTDLVFNMTEIMNNESSTTMYFIYVLRDPRAVFFSQLNSKNSYTGLPMEVDSVRFSKTWAEHIKAFKSITNAHLVQYENLVTEFDHVFAELVEVFGIEQSYMQQKEYRFGISQKHLHENVAKSPDKKRINKWKNNLSVFHEAILNENLDVLMKEYGYEVTEQKVSCIRLLVFKAIMWGKRIRMKFLSSASYRLKCSM